MNSCYRLFFFKLSSLFNYKKSNVEAVFEVCTVCFGVFHFSHWDGKEILVKRKKKKSANDMAIAIFEFVSHQIENFSLKCSYLQIL